MKKSKKRYYLPSIEEPPNQLIETPASKERTDKRRFVINTVISAIAAIVAAVVTLVKVI